MKLKESFITQNIDGEQIMVSADSNAFCGIVRSNATAAFIVDTLGQETTEEGIVAAMLEKYDVAEETVRRDVQAILEKLRSIGAIDE